MEAGSEREVDICRLDLVSLELVHDRCFSPCHWISYCD
jgi:hypothetical protein